MKFSDLEKQLNSMSKSQLEDLRFRVTDKILKKVHLAMYFGVIIMLISFGCFYLGFKIAAVLSLMFSVGAIIFIIIIAETCLYFVNIILKGKINNK